MKELDYWNYGPRDPNDEWVGRRLINAFDVEETVVLQVSHWKHFDWLVGQGANMKKWVKDVDLSRHNSQYTASLNRQIILALIGDEKQRFLSGQPCPLFITPEGYAEPTEVTRKLPSLKMIEREIINAEDEIVIVEMPQNYWQYLDWLVEQGVDIAQWVKDADMSRLKKGFEFTLSSELRQSLRQDEARRSKNGEDMPISIALNHPTT